MDENNHKRYRFANILIDEDQRVVLFEGREVSVQPRVFDFLVYLIQNHDRAVSKEELQDAVWPGMVVSETVLSRAVMKARKAVGDDAQAQSVIRTLHGHGYRFVAELDTDETATQEQDAPPDMGDEEAEPGDRLADRFTALVLLLVLVTISIFLGRKFFEQDVSPALPPGEGVSIAVLPFTNLGDDKDSEYFSDGLSEEVMNRLARVSGLLVVARTSAFSFKGSNEGSRTIASELQVTHLIDGSVRRDGNQLRVNAQLLDSNGFQLWSKSYTGVLVDVFSLQDSIANDIVSQVRPSLPVDSQDAPFETVPPTANLEAYEMVLRGNFHLQRRNEGPLKRSIGLFEQAIALDQGYGDAYVGLATAWASLPFYSYETPDDTYGFALEAIETGMQMDASVVTKSAAIRAFMRYNTEWSWIESERGFRQALEYTPDNAEVLQWYSLFLGSTGRTEESLRVAQRAQQLDPVSPVVNHRLAIAHLWSNNDEEAYRYFEQARELGMPAASIPGAYIILMVRMGRMEETRQVLISVQRMLGLERDWLDALVAALGDPEHIPAAIEPIAEAEKRGDVPRLFRYGIWTYLQEDDRALDVAFELIQDRPNFNTEFMFSREAAKLRTNPRFGELVEAIGLRKYWEEFGWPDDCRPEGESVVCD